MTNFKVDGEDILMGDRQCRVFSLVDVDNINLPTIIRPYTLMTVNNSEMPVDLLAGIDSIPGIESAVYNQVIFMPNQKHELAMLDKKKNRLKNGGRKEKEEDDYLSSSIILNELTRYVIRTCSIPVLSL